MKTHRSLFKSLVNFCKNIDLRLIENKIFRNKTFLFKDYEYIHIVEFVEFSSPFLLQIFNFVPIVTLGKLKF